MAEITPNHPDYGLNQQIRQGVAALDAQHGRAFDQTSERLTASLTVLAREQGLQQVDHVLVSNATANQPAGHNIFVVQGDPANPAHLRAMMPTAVAAQTPVEQSLQKLGLAPEQPAVGLQPEQQTREQEQQQNPAHGLG
ncbi:XVIPCD domain-containing protein [Stenotrophomonas maltophilia]|uniref:XVIPCD domain-containing protein n=1 Tax=Stenotrophomonas maltophilia TaxID=40324 RepID=UPI00066DC823|nr:XVIPCD domain-containing protein [Stenotrophomonas maltophilia]